MIKNKAYPVKNALCPVGCGRGWASKLYDHIPINLPWVQMLKDGKMVYYTLADKHIYDIINNTKEHLDE